MTDRERLKNVVAEALKGEPPYIYRGASGDEDMTWIVYEVFPGVSVGLSRWASAGAAKNEVKRLSAEWLAASAIAAAERSGFRFLEPDDGR